MYVCGFVFFLINGENFGAVLIEVGLCTMRNEK